MSKSLVQRLEFSDFHAISNAGVVAREYSDITAYRKAAGLYHSQGYVFEQIGYLTSAAQAYESASVCLEQLIARGREPAILYETTESDLSKQELTLCNEQACLHLAKAAQLLRSSGQPDKAAGLSLRMHGLEGPRTRTPLYRSLWGWFLACGEDPKIALLQLLNMIGFFAIGYTALVKFNKGSLLLSPA